MRPQHATNTPRWCRCASGCSAPSTPTPVVRQGLAAFTGRAGDAAAARDQSAALLPLYERVLGPEHPGTLGIRANLAGWTGAAGDPAAARDLFADVLTVRERVFGPDHPDTLATRRNLAAFTGEAGDAAAARNQFTALLPRYEAGPRPGAPGHPSHPRLARPLDRGRG